MPDDKKITKRFSRDEKASMSKVASHVTKAADAHQKLGKAIEKADTLCGASGVEKADKGGKGVDMDELRKAVGDMKDAHESLGDHLDVANAHLAKMAKPDADGDDDGDKIAKSDQPTEAPKAEDVATDEGDDTLIIAKLAPTPKLLKAYMATRDAAIAKGAMLVKAANTPAGAPRVQTYAVRKGDADLTGMGGNGEGVVGSAEEAAKTVDKDDPNAVGKAIAKMLTIPGIKQGIGRPVALDPTFQGGAAKK